jgi:hypothetical protein
LALRNSHFNVLNLVPFGSFKVLRCQLPRKNAYYDEEAGDEDYIEDEMLLDTFVRCSQPEPYPMIFAATNGLFVWVATKKPQFALCAACEETKRVAGARRSLTALRSTRRIIGHLAQMDTR